LKICVRNRKTERSTAKALAVASRGRGNFILTKIKLSVTDSLSPSQLEIVSDSVRLKLEK